MIIEKIFNQQKIAILILSQLFTIFINNSIMQI